jgi:hypothetical protein
MGSSQDDDYPAGIDDRAEWRRTHPREDVEQRTMVAKRWSSDDEQDRFERWYNNTDRADAPKMSAEASQAWNDWAKRLIDEALTKYTEKVILKTFYKKLVLKELGAALDSWAAGLRKEWRKELRDEIAKEIDKLKVEGKSGCSIIKP